MRTENPRVVTISIALLYLPGLYAFGGCQQIGQAVSRQNHPSISNPARTSVLPPGYVVGATAVHRAIPVSTPRNPNPPVVSVSNLRRNLETLFSPRFKVSIRKFGELAPLKLLAVAECRGLVK
jgi:hypothetical protein